MNDKIKKKSIIKCAYSKDDRKTYFHLGLSISFCRETINMRVAISCL